MIYLRLFFEFFKIGLFSVGGGMATIPFLSDLGEKTGWFTAGQLADMIAIAESTPGPLGVNMTTYVGFTSGGIPGGVIATLGLICPCVVIILVIARFLQKFRQSKVVDGAFYGLRAASVALITAAMLQVAKIALMFHGEPGTETVQVFTPFFGHDKNICQNGCSNCQQHSNYANRANFHTKYLVSLFSAYALS